MRNKRVGMITYGVTGDRHAPSNLAECITEFQRVLAAIPEEYRATAEICFEPHWEHGESYSQVQIDYERPMTMEELTEFNKSERDHWIERLSNAEERVAMCKREIYDHASTSQVVAA